MEEDQELRFVCKLCDKKYPSGKSLGGHMRSHVIAAAAANSAESEERFEPTMKKFSSSNGNGYGNVNSNSNYALRENPKKTWRAVDSTFPSPNEKVCKQCGKGFQSLKALCGHMACHSEKDKGLKDYDHSWTSENQNGDDDDEDEEEKLVMDSHSDTEAEDPTRITRSKTKRYKKIIVKPSSFSLTNNTYNSSNYNYGSSSVSEIDHEQEQEEVAMCLMMLSKDSANWAGVNSVVESSDNNSVVLETKSSSIDMIIGRKEWNLHQNGDERVKLKKRERKLKSSVVDAESVQFENSNSTYHRNGMRKVESDILVDELLSKEIGGAKLEIYDKKYGKTEIRKNLMREIGYGDSKKRIRDDSNPELGEDSYKKRNKYECLNCNKTFSSFQGLGGHRPCHKKITNATSSVSKYESGENSLEGRKVIYSNPKPEKQIAAEKRIRPKKGKGHECPICFRMFKSGQALGGHKRSHFINGSDHHMPVMEKEVPEFHDLIDLNLPAPEED